VTNKKLPDDMPITELCQELRQWAATLHGRERSFVTRTASALLNVPPWNENGEGAETVGALRRMSVTFLRRAPGVGRKALLFILETIDHPDWRIAREYTVQYPHDAYFSRARFERLTSALDNKGATR
jgi:hypothetical protein